MEVAIAISDGNTRFFLCKQTMAKLLCMEIVLFLTSYTATVFVSDVHTFFTHIDSCSS